MTVIQRAGEPARHYELRREEAGLSTARIRLRQGEIELAVRALVDAAKPAPVRACDWCGEPLPAGTHRKVRTHKGACSGLWFQRELIDGEVE